MRGEASTGSLIIFLSMILVAAIASGVMLFTGTTLQQDAINTGAALEEEAITNVRIVEFAGIDGSDGTLEHFMLTIKPIAGSTPIRFSQTIVSFDAGNFNADFLYREPDNSSSYCPLGDAADCTAEANDDVKGLFTVAYLQRGRNQYDGVLMPGDVAVVHFSVNASIDGSSALRVKFAPEGVPSWLEVATPEIIRGQRVGLYP